MTEGLPEGLKTRHPRADDHARVLAVLDDWWGKCGGEAGSASARCCCRDCSSSTSPTRASSSNAPTGGSSPFSSASDPGTAYIHFVGVDPNLRRTGLGATLYGKFFRQVTARGADTVKCVTSPGNTNSVAFHTGLGFRVDPSATLKNGIPVQLDYDGPGLHRVTFTRGLGGSTQRSAPVSAPLASSPRSGPVALSP